MYIVDVSCGRIYVKRKNADVTYQRHCTCNFVPQICMPTQKHKKKDGWHMKKKVISSDKPYQYLIVPNEIAFSMPKGKNIYTL